MIFSQESMADQSSQFRVLEHHQQKISQQVYTIFQRSYAIEAAILGVNDFPPLRRSASDISQSATTFYGYWEDEELAAVAEVDLSKGLLDIWSFVVDPAFFRMGIGSRLLDALFSVFPDRNRVVETGVDNQPAIALYQKKGFEIQDRWMIDIGIEKVRLTMGGASSSR